MLLSAAWPRHKYYCERITQHRAAGQPSMRSGKGVRNQCDRAHQRVAEQRVYPASLACGVCDCGELRRDMRQLAPDGSTAAGGPQAQQRAVQRLKVRCADHHGRCCLRHCSLHILQRCATGVSLMTDTYTPSSIVWTHLVWQGTAEVMCDKMPAERRWHGPGRLSSATATALLRTQCGQNPSCGAFPPRRGNQLTCANLAVHSTTTPRAAASSVFSSSIVRSCSAASCASRTGSSCWLSSSLSKRRCCGAALGPAREPFPRREQPAGSSAYYIAPVQYGHALVCVAVCAWPHYASARWPAVSSIRCCEGSICVLMTANAAAPSESIMASERARTCKRVAVLTAAHGHGPNPGSQLRRERRRVLKPPPHQVGGSQLHEVHASLSSARRSRTSA